MAFSFKSNKQEQPEVSDLSIPHHIAIIMDGNGRWAKLRGLPPAIGHKKGTERVKEIVDACGHLSVKHLTLYAFSSENWDRPEDEVNELMNLLRAYIASELGEFHKKGARLKVIGERARLAEDIRKQIADAEELTKNNAGVNVNVAISYGGRQEIVDATRKIAESKIAPSEITEKLIGDMLYNPEMPDPDLLIRTGGDHRVSNFLLWQIAYAELYFTPTLWPDFGTEELKEAIQDFAGRERRYGKR